MKLPTVELKSYKEPLPEFGPSQFGSKSRFLRSTPAKVRSNTRRDFFSRSDNQRYHRSRAFEPISKIPSPMVFLHLEKVEVDPKAAKIEGTHQTGSSSSQVHVLAEWRPIDQGAPFAYRMIGGRRLWTPKRWRNQLEHPESTNKALPITFATNGRLSDPMISRPIIPPVITLSAGRATTGCCSLLGLAGACCLWCWGSAPSSGPC